MYKKGIIFGVFDGLHDGHKFFLDKASEKCKELIVVVAQNEMVFQLKGFFSQFSYEERVEAIRKYNPRVKITASDDNMGDWLVLKKFKPDIVLLGHDQDEMASSLMKINFPFKFLEAYKPQKYKSSLLLKNRKK